MLCSSLLQSILELGKNPLSSSGKDWKPRLCVLKRHGDTKRATLDYYKDTRKRWQKQVCILYAHTKSSHLGLFILVLVVQICKYDELGGAINEFWQLDASLQHVARYILVVGLLP